MTFDIIIEVPAVPVAQPRPRATRAGRGARVYNPDTADAFKAKVALAARQAFQRGLLEGPLRVDIEFLFPRTQAQIWKRKPMPRIWHSKKPDRDNLDKAVLDTLTGIVWRDDSQVCAGSLSKMIAAGHERPGVTVRITPLDLPPETPEEQLPGRPCGRCRKEVPEDHPFDWCDSC